MDLNKYALFVDVANTKNFTKSGERMGYTQPGVSHILKSMENEMGFPLFVRTRQGVFLTPNAEKILPIVRQLLSVNEQLEQTINSLNGLSTGHLTLAAFASISRNWLPRVVYEFQREYPGIELELLEGGTDEIVEWIEDSRVDFGLISRPKTERLEWIPLHEDPLLAILPPCYPTSDMDAFPVAKMADKPFIISAKGVDYDIHHALKISGVSPNIQFSCRDDQSIIAMVHNNLGISILPELVVKGNAIPVSTLPLKPFFSRELGIAVHSMDSLTPAARQFITRLKKLLPQLLS